MHIFHNATKEKLVQRFNYVSHFQWQFSSLNRLISSRDPLPPGKLQHTLGGEGALKCSYVSLSSQPGSSPGSSPACLPPQPCASLSEAGSSGNLAPEEGAEH